MKQDKNVKLDTELTADDFGKYAHPNSLGWKGIRYIVVLNIPKSIFPVGNIANCLNQSIKVPGFSSTFPFPKPARLINLIL